MGLLRLSYRPSRPAASNQRR